MKRLVITILCALAPVAWAAPADTATCTWGTRGALLFHDDFHKPLQGYVAEYAHKPGNVIESRDGHLLMDVDSGATLWVGQELHGNVLITFTRRIVVDGGKNDRLSDLNFFWMARDPHDANLFTRSGKFEDYDNLDQYYVGIGGNTNKTTRMRRYGGGQRVIVGEYLDAPHLLQPNRDYRIEIAVHDGCTRVRVDGADWFTYRDPQPLASGWFGLRTTWSRQTVSDLAIYKLE